MANNDVLIRIGADVTAAANALGSLKSKFEAFSNLAVVGAFTGAAVAVGALIKQTADMNEEYLKTSQIVGVSVENLSKLRFAAELSETSYEDLTTGLRKLSKAIEGGNESLKALGITSKDPYEALLQIADVFSKAEDGSRKTATALEIFGKSGATLIPILNQGRAGIKGMGDELQRMGGVISTDMAKASDEFNDNLVRLQHNLNSILRPALSASIGWLNDFYYALNPTKRPEIDQLSRRATEIQAALGKLRATAENGDIIEGMTGIQTPGSKSAKANAQAMINDYEKELVTIQRKISAINAKVSKPKNFTFPPIKTEKPLKQGATNEDNQQLAEENSLIARWNSLVGERNTLRAKNMYYNDTEKQQLGELDGKYTELMEAVGKLNSEYLKKHGITKETVNAARQEAMALEGEIQQKAVIESLKGESLDDITKKYDKMREAAKAYYADKKGLAQESAQVMAAIDRQEAVSKIQAVQQGWGGVAGIVAGQLGAIAGMMDKGNKNQFEAWKRLMQAQAVIATAMGVMQAWIAAGQAAALAGPAAPAIFTAVGAALSTLITGVGVAQIAIIEAQQYQPPTYHTGGVITGGMRNAMGEVPIIAQVGEGVVSRAGMQALTDINGGRIGGTTNVVFNISPGVSGAVRSELMKAVPALRQMAVSAVSEAISSGGSMSRQVGRRP